MSELRRDPVAKRWVIVSTERSRRPGDFTLEKEPVAMRAYAIEKGVFALGPTTPGILVPGKGKMGIMPGSLFAPGHVGIISRSGTLSYEFAGILSELHVGQSSVVGMGADPVVLTNLADILRLFEEDRETDAVIIVGEVGGEQEERAAGYIQEKMTKPVDAYIRPPLASGEAHGPCRRYCSGFCRYGCWQAGGLAHGRG